MTTLRPRPADAAMDAHRSATIDEAFLEGSWWLFDPTGMAPEGALVRIGYGRDATNVSFCTLVDAADVPASREGAVFDDVRCPCHGTHFDLAGQRTGRPAFRIGEESAS